MRPISLEGPEKSFKYIIEINLLSLERERRRSSAVRERERGWASENKWFGPFEETMNGFAERKQREGSDKKLTAKTAIMGINCNQIIN